MKKVTYSFVVILILALVCNAQTSKRYYETFENISTLDWAFLAPQADFSVQNGELKFTSNSDDFVYFFPPMDATKDDFSIEIKPGGTITGIEAGGFGRAGFKSFLGILISGPLFGDSITVVYLDEIQNSEEPQFNLLAKYPIPEFVNSLKLDVKSSGSNILINAFVNGTMFYDGQITNADPGLFYGKMMLMLDPKDGEGYKEWALDEIDIRYNPMIEPAGNFADEFDNPNTPWYRYDDSMGNLVSVANGKLNFNYVGDEEKPLYVLPPVGLVKDFSIEMEVGVEGDHNAPFGISRFIDFKNYITAYFDEEYLVLAYASESYEPVELDRKIPEVTNPVNIKFSIDGDAAAQTAKVFVNNNLVVSGTVNIADKPKLASGHIILGFERGTNINGYINSATINYNGAPTEDPGYMNHITDKLTLSVFPNSLLGHSQDATRGEGLLYQKQNDMMWSGGIIFGNANKGISGMLGSYRLYDITEKEKVASADPGSYFDRKLTTRYSDENYSGKYGVEVYQESFSRTDKNFVVLRYALKNVSGGSLDNFYLGMFGDFDIGEATDDLNGYDAARNLIFVYDPVLSVHFGLIALDGMAGGKSTIEEGNRTSSINFATNNDYTASQTKGDYRCLISSGPLNIPNQGEVLKSFAIVGADNYAELIATADEAINIYNSQFVDVEEDMVSLPEQFLLHQNYPNPFNPSTTIRYNVPVVDALSGVEGRHVQLMVYDMLGREVATLVNEQQSPGYYEVQFDGSRLASGIYLYKLQAGSYNSTKKLMLLK